MPTPGPLCFVLMPFGKKVDVAGMTIDFDAVYQEVIKPAILEVGLDPLRADEEMTGGIIHKPMYERLILCPFAVADLTTANANVFYELGVRHAVRPASTVLLFAKGTMRQSWSSPCSRGTATRRSTRLPESSPMCARSGNRKRRCATSI